MRTSVENETHDVESDTDVVLRLYGEQLDVDACLTWLPASKVAQAWRKGESRRGKRSETSGCNVVLAEGMARESVVQGAARAFSELAEPISELVRSGAEALADFGLYVEIGGEPFPLSLPPEVMALFARAGVIIGVSAYPRPAEGGELDGEDDDDEEHGALVEQDAELAEEVFAHAYEAVHLDEHEMDEDARTNARVVLRVHDDRLDAEACRAWLPPHLPSRLWRSGEKDSQGRINARAGFRVALAAGPAHGPIVEDAAHALCELAEPVARLVRGGADARAYFALLLYVRGAPASVYFEPEEAGVFARAAVTIEMQAHTKPLVPTGRPTSWPVISEVIRRLRGARRERLH